MPFLIGKRILITGMASHRSIAWGIAKAMKREGAELAFTYQNDKLKSRVQKLASNFNSDIVLPCDVSDDNNIKILFECLKKFWLKFDGLVHSIAYAPSDQLKGNYIDVITQQGFSIAHTISSYSFVALAKASQSMLNTNSSLVTLTYLGSEKAIPNYNVMGLAKASLEANTRYMAYAMGSRNIRVNAISAGPIRTIASLGIKNFNKMLSYYTSNTPLRQEITIEHIGNTAAFLCSELSSGITGEIIHVDGGFNITAIHEN